MIQAYSDDLTLARNKLHSYVLHYTQLHTVSYMYCIYVFC